MNKLFKIIFDDIKKNKSIYISLILVVIIGIIFGTLFITILADTDKKLVIEKITSFFDTISNGNYVYKGALFSNILNNLIFIIIISLLGMSIIGIPIIICMLFYKGFVLAFTISSLIYTFKFNGIFLSFTYIFPHLIINLFIYFLMACYAFHFSIKLFQLVFKKEDVNIKKYIKKYSFVMLVSVITLILTSLYETYIIPSIIKLIY